MHSRSADDTDQVAIVTGAARGIGRATADRLAGDGYTVVGCDLPNVIEDSPAAAWELRSCDVANEADVSAFIAAIDQDHGRLDALINVAGVVLVKPLVETTWDEFQRVIDVNLGGIFLMCKHAIPVLARTGRGVIVNLGSVSGHVGQIDHSLYGASKGAIIALGRALAWELAPHQIRVVTVSPGSVDTPMLRGDIELESARTGTPIDQVKQLREQEQAFGRWADPAEIASAIAFLASPGASFITGADLLVDCGWVAK